MVARKRGRSEMEASAGEPVAAAAPRPAPASPLTRLRNSWVFANVMQFIWLFGTAFKIDEDFDIEDLEDECLSPNPHHKLAEIGLCLLKAISSQRGLVSNDFDEQMGRQYRRRLPDGPNPFGEEEAPQQFLDFDVHTQLRVLHQLSLWILAKPVELRERMARNEDDTQMDWRIEPVGWDRRDRTYFLLDDSRLYRRTDPPLAPPTGSVTKAKKAERTKAQQKTKPPAKPPLKPQRAGVRASKRLKVSSQTPEPEPEGVKEEEDEADTAEEHDAVAGADNQSVLQQEHDTGLGEGYRWECVAITIQEYQDFLDSIQKTRDLNERLLHKHITDEVMPMLEQAEEKRLKKIARRERELLSLEKMANAKRSSRIAGKAEREREEAERAAADEKRQKDLAAARADEERKRKMEAARQSRMVTREQRMKEREYKRILHEEELANLSEDSKRLEHGDLKVSERRLKAQMAAKQKELEAMQQAEEEWVFDCAGCGVYGENMDDGTPIIACERCNVWQHQKCLGISRDDASKDDFQFICADCLRRECEAQQREEDAKKPKIAPLKIRYDPEVEGSGPLPQAAQDGAELVKRKRGRPRKNPLAEDGSSPPAKTDGQSSGMPRMAKFKLPKPKNPESPLNTPASMQHQAPTNVLAANGHRTDASPKSVFIAFDPVAAGYASPGPHARANKPNASLPARAAPPATPSKATKPSTNGITNSHIHPNTSGTPLHAHQHNSSTSFPPPSTIQRPYPSTPASQAATHASFPPPSSAQHYRTPVPLALSPPDQKRLSPSAAPPTRPGFSPSKMSPAQVTAATPLPPATLSPANNGSPVMHPPSTNPRQAGHSPVKRPSPPPPPPLAPIDPKVLGISVAPSPATQLSPTVQFPQPTRVTVANNGNGSSDVFEGVIGNGSDKVPHPPSSPTKHTLNAHTLSTLPTAAEHPHAKAITLPESNVPTAPINGAENAHVNGLVEPKAAREGSL